VVHDELTDELRDRAALYALGVLENEEREAFEEHLAEGCDTCDAEVRAIDGIDIEFAAGAFTAIMGPSGSGKSTLMQCMAGLDQLTSGQTWIGQARVFF